MSEICNDLCTDTTTQVPKDPRRERKRLLDLAKGQGSSSSAANTRRASASQPGAQARSAVSPPAEASGTTAKRKAVGQAPSEERPEATGSKRPRVAETEGSIGEEVSTSPPMGGEAMSAGPQPASVSPTLSRASKSAAVESAEEGGQKTPRSQRSASAMSMSGVSGSPNSGGLLNPPYTQVCNLCLTLNLFLHCSYLSGTLDTALSFHSDTR